jgi:predicted  nucleic acid-binding Zn-ribbon protein
MFSNDRTLASPTPPHREIKPRILVPKFGTSSLPSALRHAKSSYQTSSSGRQAFVPLEETDSDATDIDPYLSKNSRFNPTNATRDHPSHEEPTVYPSKASRESATSTRVHQVPSSARRVSFCLPHEEVDDGGTFMSYIGNQKQLQNKRSKNDERITELQKQSESHRGSSGLSLIETTDLRRSFTILESTKQKLQDQITTLRSELHDLRVEDTYKQDKINELNKLIGKGQQDLTYTEYELSSVPKTSHGSQDKYNSLESEHNQLKSGLDSTVNAADAPSHNERLLARTKEAIVERDNIHRSFLKLNKAYNELADKHRACISEIQNLKTAIEQKDTHVSQQQSRLAAQRTQIFQLQIETKELQVQLHAAILVDTPIPIPAPGSASASAALNTELQDSYNKLYAAAKAVVHFGGFLAHGDFGDIGTAFENLKGQLKD